WLTDAFVVAAIVNKGYCFEQNQLPRPFLYQVTVVLKTKQDFTDRVSLLLVHWGIRGVVLVQHANHRTDDDDYAGRAARSILRQGLCETEFVHFLVTHHFGVFRPLLSCGP
ncbi:unnamed protein product, partial [Ectocarpus sp. 4 AP-2014]